MARRGFSGAVLRGLGARDHLVTVTGREVRAPHLLRLRLEAPTLFEEAEAGPASWLRFWFPDPDGGSVEHQRAYTIVAADVDAGTFAIDVVLHEPTGPASHWARHAQIGSTIEVMALGARRFEVPDDPPAGYLLIGDSASIPALNAVVEAIPDELPIELYLEEHAPEDRLIPLADHPRLRTHWVPRHGPTSLAAAIEARDYSDWYAWVAPETGSLKHLRARLREEFGFPKSQAHLQAYWSHGRAMGTLRGPAEEETAPSPAARPAPRPADAQPADAQPTRAGEASSSPHSETPKGEWRAQAAGRLLGPLRPALVLAGAAQGLLTLVELAPFVLLVELARRLLAGAQPAQLWSVGLWALGLMAAGTLGTAALLLWLHVLDARFEHELRHRLLGKLARLPLGWFTDRGSARVKQLVQDDTLALHYLVTHAVPDAVAAAVAPLAVLGYLFAVEWRVALVLLLPVLAYLLATYSMLVRSGGKAGEYVRRTERMSGEANAYLEGQPVIRIFGGAAGSRFQAELADHLHFLRSWQRPFTGTKTFIDLATRPPTFLLLIAVAGTAAITAGAMPALDLLPFLFLGTTFGTRLLGIAYGLSGLRDGLAAARRVQVALDTPELVQREDAGPVASARGVAVEFDRVRFGYRPDLPVISGVSLRLEPGTVTALVGPSGSGKSTLAALLARFHDVDRGAIRIGGDDVRSLASDELYTRVSFVFQQTQLVQGTVRENIALAVPDASEEQVVAAARAAQIHERILALPEGYDTELGPDAALSGGERQRLTIARAMLADAPVLVLDEATAFADPESEYLVQRALDRLRAGRTVLVIAHRLHTITGADQIVVLEGGRMAEHGTHADLLAARGRYHRMWTAGGVGEFARDAEVEAR